MLFLKRFYSLCYCAAMCMLWMFGDGASSQTIHIVLLLRAKDSAHKHVYANGRILWLKFGISGIKGKHEGERLQKPLHIRINTHMQQQQQQHTSGRQCNPMECNEMAFVQYPWQHKKLICNSNISKYHAEYWMACRLYTPNCKPPNRTNMRQRSTPQWRK